MADNGSIASNVIREGFLTLKDTKKQSWMRTYCRLDNFYLCFGKNQEDCAKGKCDIRIGKNDRLTVEKEESEDRKQTFLLRTRQKSGDTDIKILVAASDNDEREKWIESIKKFSDYYPDEKLERENKVASIIRTETTGSKDSGYNSRSSQRFSNCTNFEFTRTYSSQQTSPGEQEEEHEKSRTICETRELAQDSRQDYPDFISSDFRPRSNVLTKRTTMNCPHCHKEIDLNPRPVCSGRTNNPTEHDSRTEGQPNTPSEHAENID